MLSRLRNRLRKWLGVDDCVTQEDSKFYITQLDALNTALVEQGKSFAKQTQQHANIIRGLCERTDAFIRDQSKQLPAKKPSTRAKKCRARNAKG